METTNNFDRSVQTRPYIGVEIISSINNAGKFVCINIKNETRSLSHIRNKITWQWIKDLNVRLKTMKLLKENVEGGKSNMVEEQMEYSVRWGIV